MTINVLFFGVTADVAGKRSMEISVGDNASTRAVFDQVKAQYPELQDHKLLFAVNQEYLVAGEHLVRDGDEIAIFTAVSGG